MQLSKEILQNDRKVFSEQLANTQTLVNYIDGLLAFLDKPEPTESAPVPVVDLVSEPAIEGEVV